MSKLFFDHLINLSELESVIKNICITPEEKEELWNLIDGLIQIRVIENVLDLLPEENHYEFLEMYHKCPYDETIFQFIDEVVGSDIEEAISKEVSSLQDKLVREIVGG